MERTPLTSKKTIYKLKVTKLYLRQMEESTVCGIESQERMLMH